MANLATTLRTEIRKLAAPEIQKTVRAMTKMRRQIRGLRATVRSQNLKLASLDRRIGRLRERVGAGAGPGDDAPAITPSAIRALRGVLPRIEFAKLVGVSPGSIFGWETGRTVPRGKSRKRLLELKELGIAERAAEERADRRRARRAGTNPGRRKKKPGRPPSKKKARKKKR